MTQASLGLIGLGTMGGNLARNCVAHGFQVALYDPAPDTAAKLAQELGEKATSYASHEALVAALASPRAVLLMVPAGAAVDETLAALRPNLAAGDLVIDGGNSHFADTERRVKECGGIHFLGFGISGGAEGARTGPSIMAGGDEAAIGRITPLFNAIAAKVGPDPCFARLGPSGAGHFVKMVHNGIEYALMQQIAEAYHLLRNLLGLKVQRVRSVFRKWSEGTLQSFLIDCAIRVLEQTDRKSGEFLIDLIADTAAQKGTGAWAANTALEWGVAAPTLAEAVHARCLSALRAERVAREREFGKITRPFGGDIEIESFIGLTEQALQLGHVAAHAQGFALIGAAAREKRWQIDRVAVARVWRAGCIIRSKLLDGIIGAFQARQDIPNLLADPETRKFVGHLEGGLRAIVIQAAAHRVPVPGLASALGYIDAYYTGKLWANMTAAQRDVFGAHGFERLDQPGLHHADWTAQ
jgi:6-phosphogluconate dehydrogenase